MSERRIAMISEHASPVAVLGAADSGGQNVYVDELSRHLGGLGFAVDVFTRWTAPDQPAVLHWAPNVRVIPVRAGAAASIFRDDLWPIMPAFRDAVLRQLRDSGARYDLVHGHFWMSGWVATEMKRMLGLPVVQLFHATGLTKRRHQGADDTSPPHRIAVERAIIRLADRVIAQCPEEHRELVDGYGGDPARIPIVPAAVNTRRFRPVDQAAARGALGLDRDDRIILSLGRILPRKDIRNVLHALALLDDMRPAVKLLVVGGDSERPEPALTPELGVLRALAAELNVLDRVIFTGRRQPDLLWLYYGAADVMVTTPWYEPFGLTPLEAMACARPVIGSDVGGIRFTVQPEVTGYLVPRRDPAALATRLRQLLSEPELCRRMGEAGRRRVEEEFTWPRTAHRIAGVYDEVLREPLRSSPTGDEIETAPAAPPDPREEPRGSISWSRP